MRRGQCKNFALPVFAHKRRKIEEKERCVEKVRKCFRLAVEVEFRAKKAYDNKAFAFPDKIFAPSNDNVKSGRVILLFDARGGAKFSVILICFGAARILRAAPILEAD